MPKAYRLEVVVESIAEFADLPEKSGWRTPSGPAAAATVPPRPDRKDARAPRPSSNDRGAWMTVTRKHPAYTRPK